MWFTRVSINNPVFATMVMAAIMVLGLFSYQRLSIEQMPDVSIPVAVVRTPYPGASAEAVEQEVTRRIEEAVNTVSGIRTIRSGSQLGMSWVVAEFELDVDIKTAIQDVRDKVAEARRQFNRDVGEPTVSRADNDNDQPVVYLTMQSDVRSLREVSDIAEDLVAKRLQGAPGVGNVEVNGSVQRELAIRLKPEMMAAYGVGIDQIIAAVRVENQDAPAGSLVSDKMERVVRVQGKIKSPQDFERIIVARRGTGAATTAVTLGQLAEVRDTQREENSLATMDGKRSISIQIRKTRGANTIEMAAAIRKQIETLKKSLPADVKLEVSFDRSEFIKDSVNNVRHTIIEGALLTVLIVFLFLHSWRSTVITGLTLPISVFATFIAMYAFGFTINFITLLALSLSIGVLIDDAIVVRENIVRHLKMGKTHRQAALEATREIGLAVMATTFTIVAVFVPVAFMGGIIGKFFYQFGITVVVAVMVSLFVSFTLDPMLSSVWKDPPSAWMERGPLGWVLRQQERFMDWLHAKYDAILRWAFKPDYRKLWVPTFSFSERRFRRATIRNRGIVLWMAALTLVAAFGLLMSGLLKSEFQPQVDEGWTSLRIQTPVGSSLAYTTSKAEQVEEALKDYPEIKHLSKSVWRNSAWFEIQLTPKKERKRSQKEMDDVFRDRLKRVAGLEVQHWLEPPDPHLRAGLGHQGAGPHLAGRDREDQAGEGHGGRGEQLQAHQPGARHRGKPRARERHGGVDAADRHHHARDARRRAGRPMGRPGRREPPDHDPAAARRTHRHRRPRQDLRRLLLVQRGCDAAHGAAAPDRGVQAVALRAHDRAPQPPAPDPDLGRRGQRRNLGRGAGGGSQDHGRHGAAARLPLRLRRGRRDDAGVGQVRADRARHRRDLHLPRARLAVRQLPPAAGDHGLAPAVADRRVPGAHDLPQHAEHLLGDRLHHADGPRHQKRDPAGGLHEPGHPRGQGPLHGDPRRGPGAAAADPHDDGGHGLRHAAPGPRPRRGLGAAVADGARGDRRHHHLDGAHARGRAGPLHLLRHAGPQGHGVHHEGRRRAPRRAGRAARGGRRLTDLLQRSFGFSGSASPQEIKARYRSLAQRCAQPDASADEIERLRVASVALAQELVFIGFDRDQVEQALADEGCPAPVAAEGAAAIAGSVSRRVKSPLERELVSPVDAAYARLADRTVAAESARTMTPSSYGLGFIIKLAVAFVVIMGALVTSLDFFPRILRPAKVEPGPVPIQLLPAEAPKNK